MNGKHTLRQFDEDLERLSGEVNQLGEQVLLELEQALAALASGDHSRLAAIIDSDRRADALLDSINHHATQVLVRQQAMAVDLRMIVAASRIGLHLERIGDYAKNTAKRTERITGSLDAELLAQFHWMGARVLAMLRRVMEAYQQGDAELANVAWTDDAELDSVYANLFARLLELLSQAPDAAANLVQLLFIAKGLERAGDHVTDIAEEVFFMIRGTPLAGQRPKVEETVAVSTRHI